MKFEDITYNMMDNETARQLVVLESLVEANSYYQEMIKDPLGYELHNFVTEGLYQNLGILILEGFNPFKAMGKAIKKVFEWISKFMRWFRERLSRAWKAIVGFFTGGSKKASKEMTKFVKEDEDKAQLIRDTVFNEIVSKGLYKPTKTAAQLKAELANKTEGDDDISDMKTGIDFNKVRNVVYGNTEVKELSRKELLVGFVCLATTDLFTVENDNWSTMMASAKEVGKQNDKTVYDCSPIDFKSVTLRGLPSRYLKELNQTLSKYQEKPLGDQKDLTNESYDFQNFGPGGRVEDTLKKMEEKAKEVNVASPAGDPVRFSWSMGMRGFLYTAGWIQKTDGSGIELQSTTGVKVTHTSYGAKIQSGGEEKKEEANGNGAFVLRAPTELLSSFKGYIDLMAGETLKKEFEELERLLKDGEAITSKIAGEISGDGEKDGKKEENKEEGQESKPADNAEQKADGQNPSGMMVSLNFQRMVLWCISQWTEAMQKHAVEHVKFSAMNIKFLELAKAVHQKVAAEDLFKAMGGAPDTNDGDKKDEGSEEKKEESSSDKGNDEPPGVKPESGQSPRKESRSSVQVMNDRNRSYKNNKSAKK